MAWNGVDYIKMPLEKKAEAIRHYVVGYKKGIIPIGDVKFCIASLYCGCKTSSVKLSKKAYEQICKHAPKLVDGLFVKNNEKALIRPFDGDKKSPNRLRVEHTIPTNITAKKLLSEPLHDVAWYKDFIEKYCIITYITYAEDELLNKAKLRSTMPVGWTWENGNQYARYDAVGIELAN